MARIALPTLTPWITDVRSLSNYRYIRFKATLINNVLNRTGPAIDTISIPYTHK